MYIFMVFALLLMLMLTHKTRLRAILSEYFIHTYIKPHREMPYFYDAI